MHVKVTNSSVRLHKDLFLNCMTVQMAELSVVCHSLAYLFVFSQQILRYNCVFLDSMLKTIVLQWNSCEGVSLIVKHWCCHHFSPYPMYEI